MDMDTQPQGQQAAVPVFQPQVEYTQTHTCVQAPSNFQPGLAWQKWDDSEKTDTCQIFCLTFFYLGVQDCCLNVFWFFSVTELAKNWYT